MRIRHVVALLVVALGVAGCDPIKAPKQAVPGQPEPAPESQADKPADKPPDWPPPPTAAKAHKKLYQGRTLEQWAEALNAKEEEEIWRAARALHILGAAGRPFLYRGLESPSVHTRRICLMVLTVADIRCYGDDGRRRLVELAGDQEDMRIRERASYYLAMWRKVVPAS
jgi:hypothetical protein